MLVQFDLMPPKFDAPDLTDAERADIWKKVAMEHFELLSKISEAVNEPNRTPLERAGRALWLLQQEGIE
jgi:hypothetical protein